MITSVSSRSIGPGWTVAAAIASAPSAAVSPAAVLGVLDQLTLPGAFVRNDLLDLLERDRVLRAEEFLGPLPESLFARPAVGNFSPAVPVGDPAIAVADKNGVHS
jgi:hypothetical protein